MTLLPLRLASGDDLRRAIEAAVASRGASAAFVLSGIGSLSVTKLRLAGADAAIEMQGDIEILTLAGSIATNGSHLHMSVADADGRVLGGHAAHGCVVRTTVELLLALLPAHRFTREADAATGYEELVIRSIPNT